MSSKSARKKKRWKKQLRVRKRLRGRQMALRDLIRPNALNSIDGYAIPVSDSLYVTCDADGLRVRVFRSGALSCYTDMATKTIPWCELKRHLLDSTEWIKDWQESQPKSALQLLAEVA